MSHRRGHRVRRPIHRRRRRAARQQGRHAAPGRRHRTARRAPTRRAAPPKSRRPARPKGPHAARHGPPRPRPRRTFTRLGPPSRRRRSTCSTGRGPACWRRAAPATPASDTSKPISVRSGPRPPSSRLGACRVGQGHPAAGGPSGPVRPGRDRAACGSCSLGSRPSSPSGRRSSRLQHAAGQQSSEVAGSPRGSPTTCYGRPRTSSRSSKTCSVCLGTTRWARSLVTSHR